MGCLVKLHMAVNIKQLLCNNNINYRGKLITFTTLFLLIFNKTCDSGKSEEVITPTKEYCEGDTFTADCGVNEVIMVQSAHYGLMHNSKTCRQEVPSVDPRQCDIDVINILDERCSGRRSCSVNVVDVFQRVPPARRSCLASYRGFLEVSYKCVTVLKPSHSCTLDLSTVQQPSGYISSIISNTTKCGASDRPWLISTAEEQRIKFILYDFAVYVRNKDGLKSDEIPGTCRVYVVIKEGKIPNSDTICGQYTRENAVYESMSDQMEIRVMEKHHFFLLKYQAIGCGDVPVPPGGWVKRNGDHASVGCDGTNVEWRYMCVGNQWKGKPGDCEKMGKQLEIGASTTGSNSFLGGIFGSHWFAILAITSIAITVAVCILIAGIVYIKRKHVYISNPPPSRDPYKYGTTDLPKPPTHGDSIYNSDRIPYGPVDPNDHEYLKTIERQRLMLIGQHPQQHFATLQNNFQWPERPETEHIYELPKFEIDPNMKQNSDIKCVPLPPRLPAQQFDLDPRMSGPSSNSNEGNRNINNRSV